MLRDYCFTAPDPLSLARAFDIPMIDIAVRLGLTSAYIRRLAGHAKHARRVRCAVLELALEKERLAGALSSADGRYVAFMSVASNLVPGDTNGKQDIFVHDRETGQTERVSVDSSGNEGSDSSLSSDSYGPSI